MIIPAFGVGIATKREKRLLLGIAKSYADIKFAEFELAQLFVKRLERKMKKQETIVKRKNKRHVPRQVQAVPANRSS